MFKLFGDIEEGKSKYFWFADKYRRHFIKEVYRTFDTIEFWVMGNLGSRPVEEWIDFNEHVFLGPVKPYEEPQ